jgi:hypothetical protein
MADDIQQYEFTAEEEKAMRARPYGAMAYGRAQAREQAALSLSSPPAQPPKPPGFMPD